MKEPIRICFVAHLAYGAVSGGAGGFVGGVERQISLMARWFAAHGCLTSVLTWDEGQEDGVVIDGVRVFKMCRMDAGIKGLRFVWPQWASLVAAMKRADADIYYQNCAEYTTGQTSLWCRRNKRAFVYSVASDPDCDVRLPEMHKIRERVLYRYGLLHADRVLVQTRKQQDMLRSGFRRDSIVIPMPCPGPSQEEYGGWEQRRSSSQRVLWIGRICEIKRPDRLLDLAEGCPDIGFDFVGPADGTEYSRKVCDRAKSLTNVTLHGPASRERVPEFYKRARVMCCTSDFEGFPNTFLEAWSWGIPVVSTVDPDKLIAEKGLGSVGDSVDALAAGIRQMLSSSEQWRAASRAAREFYVENHTMDAAMENFERVFREVVGRSNHT